MTEKNLSSNPAFCILPFISRYKTAQGKDRLCCHSVSDIDISQYPDLRSRMMTGQKIDHCRYCYNLEDKNIISPRQRETMRWLKDQSVIRYVQDWTPESSEKIFYYDLRWDDKCNLACIGCGPSNSSLWQKELKIPINPPSEKIQIDDWDTVKKIYLAGGEPFLIESILGLIEEVSRRHTQPEIVINTNLTRINDKLKSWLESIKNLTLVVSVDAFGKVNEYHRWPLAWDKFLDNLHYISNLDCSIQFNTVASAVSVLDIGRLVELEHMIDFWNIELLSDPQWLCVQNLPDRLKDRGLDSAIGLKRSKFYDTDPIYKSQVDALLLQIPISGNSKSLAVNIQDLDFRRHIDHRKYLGVELI